MSEELRVIKYQSVVDGLRDSAFAVNHEPPTIDIRTEVEEFCHSLRDSPRESRPSAVAAYVKPLVHEALGRWQSLMGGCHDLLVKIHDTGKRLEEERTKAELAARSAERQIANDEFEIGRLQEKRRKDETLLSTITAPTWYTRWTYRIMLIGSLLLGIGTVWYYLTIQLQIAAANAGDPSGSALQLLNLHPENFIYIFGAVIFLLAGKAVSVIHAHINHPKWFMIAVCIIATASPVGSAILIGNVSALHQELVQVERAIDAVENPHGFTTLNCSEEPDKSTSSCKKLDDLKDQQRSKSSAVAGQSFWMTILVLLSEIALGSVAWMLASQYHEKHNLEDGSIRKRIDGAAAQISAFHSQIEEARRVIEREEHNRVAVDKMIHQLDEVKPRLPSPDNIDRQFQTILDREINRAKAVLARVEYNWDHSQGGA